MLYALSRNTVCVRSIVVLTAALAASFVAAPAAAQWKPDRPVEIIVGSAPGGGNDKSARVMQRIFKDIGLVEVNVVNRVGGGGAVAYKMGGASCRESRE